MSYTIIYQIQVVKFPEANWYGDDYYAVLHEAGSNNCWEAGNRRRARDWQCTVTGEHHRIIERICEHAGYCEGGGVTLSGQTRTTPEKFIARHRKAIKDAVIGIEGAAELGFQLSAVALLCIKDKTDAYHISKLVEKGATEAESTADNYRKFTFDLTKPEDVNLWAEHAPSRGHSAMEVVGPEHVNRW